MPRSRPETDAHAIKLHKPDVDPMPCSRIYVNMIRYSYYGYGRNQTNVKRLYELCRFATMLIIGDRKISAKDRDKLITKRVYQVWMGSKTRGFN